MAKLSAKDHEYRRTTTSVSSINYHFVFVPKRLRAILVGGVAKRLQEIIFALVLEHDWKLMALEVMPDHVHLFINAPTRESASEIVRWVKGRSSRLLREEFPLLKKLPALWTPVLSQLRHLRAWLASYFVATTGQVSTETIRRYIENQRAR
jgi:putative transposase